MRILIYLAIAVVAGYLGYKIAEITIQNKKISTNIKPIVDELKTQLTAIQTELQENLTAEQRAALEAKKASIMQLLANFYGYTVEQIQALIKA